MTQHPFFSLPEPAVFGHRGAAGRAPENTLESFARASADGAHVLESDVHLSQDGEVIIMHDPVIDRTTDGRGKISDMTLGEIRRLDAGYRFTPDGGKTFPFRGKGVKVPTLREVFEAHPEAKFNLEIKDRDPVLVQKVVELVRAFNREDKTLLTAGGRGAMRLLRDEVAKTGSRAALGASKVEVVKFLRSFLTNGKPPGGVMALEVPETFSGMTLVTKGFVDHAHKHGIKVYVWTINDPAKMKDLFARGVDGVFSDVPDTALKAAAGFRAGPARPRRPRPGG